MMTKLNVYLDIDHVVADSAQAMCDWYNMAYLYHPDFKPAIGKNIYRWDAKDTLPLLQDGEIETIFNSDFFFKYVQIKKDAYKVLKRMSECGKYNLSFCSIGTATNISKKIIWLNENFPFITHQQMLVQGRCKDFKMDKSKIVSDGLLLDDHQNNLIGAKYPVMMRDCGEKEWNREWKGSFITSWLEFEKLAAEAYVLEQFER